MMTRQTPHCGRFSSVAALIMLASCATASVRTKEIAPHSAKDRKVHRLYLVVDHSKLSAQYEAAEGGVTKHARKMSEELSPLLVDELVGLLVAEGIVVDGRGFPPPLFDDAEKRTNSLVRKTFDRRRDAAIARDVATFSPDAVLRVILTKVSPGWNFYSGDIRALEYEVTLQEPSGQSLRWHAQASNGGVSMWGSLWRKGFAKMAAELVDGLKTAHLI